MELVTQINCAGTVHSNKQRTAQQPLFTTSSAIARGLQQTVQQAKNNIITTSTTAKNDFKNGTTGDRGGSPPYQHDVQEWSRLDARTGFMEHARVQQHHWSNNTQNFMQQYGKVSDHYFLDLFTKHIIIFVCITIFNSFPKTGKDKLPLL